MIKFFRKIRQKLLSENKFSKYLIYAIGEIVLVVIGILIALQINNKNDERKNEQKVQNLLVKVQSNIKADLQRMDWLLKNYSKRDSIGWLVLTDNVTREDYENPNSVLLHSLVFSYEQINLKKQGFENLMLQQDIISSEYDSIMDNLSTLYVDFLDFVMVSENQFKDYIISLNRQVAKDYEWYSEILPGYLNKEKIDFHLNDQKYKGMVKLNKQGSIGDYITFILQYREQAIKTYQIIDKRLNRNNHNDELKKFGFHDSTYVGKYRLINGINTEAFLHNGFLHTIINNDTLMMHRYSNNKYAVGRGNFFRFEEVNDSIKIYLHSFQASRTPIGVKLK